MSQEPAPARGPLGALVIDTMKSLSFGLANVVDLTVGAVDPIRVIPAINDWGGPLELSHARLVLHYAGYPARSWDGYTEVDLRVDGESILDGTYIEIPPRAVVSVYDAYSMLHAFPEGVVVQNGDEITIYVVSGGDTEDTDPENYPAQGFGSFIIYGYPTGR